MQIRVILSQLNSELGDKESNIAKINDVLEKHVNKEEYTLVLFPEMYLTGYMIKEMVFKLAEEIPGPSTRKIQQILQDYPKTIIAIGMPELGVYPRGVIYNSYVYVSSRGVEEVFRKRHFPTFGVFDEYRYFKPGPFILPNLIEFNGFRIGSQICYDTFFPEVIRALALIGADLVAIPSAAPTASRPLWPKILYSRAVENTIFIAYINTVGYQDDLEFFGESRLIDPLGKDIIRARAYKEDIVSTIIDLSTIIRARSIRPVQKDIDYGDLIMLSNAYEEHFS